MRRAPTSFIPLPWGDLGTPPWAPPRLPRTAALPGRAEVAIAGAGVTGLSCAIALARAGRRVVVVDRGFGAGATARSGGIVVGDTLMGSDPRFEGCAEALREVVSSGGDACGFEWSACWELERRADLAATPVDWRDAGVIRVSGAVPGGTIDPARLLTRLAADADAAGVTIVDRAPVIAWRAEGPAVRLITAAGDLTADRLILGVDATCAPESGDPWPIRVLTVALETEPIDAARAEAIGWQSRAPFYTNDFPLLWGRSTADGSFVMGRELIPLETIAAERMGAAIAAAGDRLIARLHGLHPALAGVGVRRVWAGPIARDDAGRPDLVVDEAAPRVWMAGGYGGHGLAQAFRLGTLAAARILG